ncbi:MobC family plasmid mobilization relaxosome protein [Caproiciproducens galactitolivorans]|uniref:Bacterial mobilization protein (MobC) n=1 Tax=Caproiciproducens galactitolivorans TaxID=642589 RepID=A0A4Z0Y5A4_9FIRM|nr:plasmid mobilization relaxosome protein MobC [Caproiciproducens galactitolivorans]QEY34206.1 MobC family plasmid mobilization relaxosome protein [Caproiciproducens galactitolivorans]TGJ78037.1 bacterial mobilization protein (MobC) [Caproiciproducens galactitolivorans]HPR90650.1 plasmid mobilization relaxosome protein MobC [Synergistaceae bacterium]
MKDKFETFRACEKERQALKTLARKANMSKSDFIRHAIFNKEIVVIDGLHELTRELKAIGNNLNQLTVRANMGQLRAVDLSETKDALGGIFDRLTALCSGSAAPLVAEPQTEPEQAVKCEPTPSPIVVDRRRQMMELFGISEVPHGNR